MYSRLGRNKKVILSYTDDEDVVDDLQRLLSFFNEQGMKSSFSFSSRYIFIGDRPHYILFINFYHKRY